MKAGPIALGKWLPDLPYYNNPGLVEAKNVIPVDGSYEPYLTLLTSGDALAARPQGACSVLDTSGAPEIYAGTADSLFQKVGSTWTDRSGAVYTTAIDGYWRFSQFDSYVITTNYGDVPQVRTIGSGTNFAALATSGTAPRARQIGVINRFVMLGDIDDGTVLPYGVQWCAINDPRTWPTPNTIAARTVQSGHELLNSAYGIVTAIANGQFAGLVFQQRGITRFTYVGGDQVFQVQEIDVSRGCWAPQSMAQVGQVCYFLAADGWYATDGQAAVPIGNAEVDKTFYLEFDQTYKERVTHAIDLNKKVILWAYPSSSATSGVPDRLICYNFVEKRWARSEDTIQMIFSSLSSAYTLEQLDSLFSSIDDMTVSLDSALWIGGIPQVMGFVSNTIGTFTGNALDARFETGEAELNPMGLTYVEGVKPLITGDPTAVSMSLSLRDAQDNEGRSFSAPVTRTTRTGVCDFHNQGRYASVRLDVEGGFTKAMALQFITVPGDDV